MTLDDLIQEQKRKSFSHPDNVSDAEACGVLLSQHFEWDGLAILEVAASALEDANFHTESAAVTALLERAEKDYGVTGGASL